jgi:D-glycero-alpha-D-manno-heptose 1-phosphate guanylyltransferase
LSTSILPGTVCRLGRRGTIDMDAVILAGGFGTRLKSVINDLPKPMAPIGNKPFLEYLFCYLSKNSVSRFIVCSGFKHEAIENYFGQVFNGIPIVYSIETEPLGTGGAVQKAQHLIANETFILLNGYTFFSIDLNSLAKEHTRTGADITIALKKMTDFDRYGTVSLEKDRIVKFKEKRKLSHGLINGGVYNINKKIFDDLRLPARFSFEKDVLEKSVNDFYLSGIVFDDYFIDIGIPEDYNRAQTEIIKTGNCI